MMLTTTKVLFQSSQQMKEIEDGSVDLILTSPPYPMIEMWDQQFAQLDPAIEEALSLSKGHKAFRLMHEVLLPVWKECFRVLGPGGIACINVGDATRTIGGQFQMYPNHAATTEQLVQLGFSQLTGILWRKPTNSTSKFLGAGMLGLNAYVTLEHEHILIFRKGENRSVTGKAKNDRRESAYFYEERNRWFSDLWTDLKGTRQAISNGYTELRERSGAFPLELPLRLIEMYSIYGDTVLDPFWGTGTTSLAAAMKARNSIGYELNENFWPLFEKRMGRLPRLSKSYNADRISKHIEFVENRKSQGKPPKYENQFYGFGVVTKQERHIKFYDATSAEKEEDKTFQHTYSPHTIQRDIFAGTE